MYWIIKHYLNETGQIIAYEVESGPFGTYERVAEARFSLNQKAPNALIRYGAWSMEEVISFFGKKFRVGLRKEEGGEKDGNNNVHGRQVFSIIRKRSLPDGARL